MTEQNVTPQTDGANEKPQPARFTRTSYSGQMLGGRYLLEDELGWGGMAVVYKAKDTVLDRDVAVKVMQPQFARDASFEHRFEREAKSAAGLANPHIVSVYDWSNKDGLCYIVMELLKGEDVKTIIGEKGPFDCRSTARIASQLCEALTEAHSKGIIHRDIKPQNIMILKDGNVKLMDFGIARPNNSDLTTAAVVLGTAHYISPEQAQVGDIGPAADLYSLGIVMYECVTGKLPFDGDNATAVALKQVTERPVPPSQINPLVDPTMEKIILKCMAKKPSNRFASAQELKMVLDAYLRGQTFEAPKASSFSNAETAAIGVVPAAAAGAAYAADRTQMMPQAGDARQAAGQSGDQHSYLGSDGNGTPPEEEPWLTTKKKVLIGIAIVVLLALIGVGIGFALNGGKGNSNTNNNNNENLVNTNTNNENVNKNEPVDPRVVVPNLTGKTREQAVFSIEAVGLVSKVEERFDETIAEGLVIEQNPKDGTKLDKGQTVTIIVSKGSEITTVPNVVGMTSGNAQAALINAGFVIGDITEEDSSQASGTVIRQDPTGEVKRGATVRLVISAGVKKVSIPGVVGLTLAESYQKLSGFQVVVNGSDDPAAIVTGQTTGQIEEGGVVTLTTRAPKNENGNNENGNSNGNSNGNANGNNEPES